MKGKRNVFWRACLGILLVLFLLAGAEGLTRVYHYYKSSGLPSEKPRHLIDFYRFYRVNPQYRTASVRINAAGFRNDEEVSPDKPPNLVRIVMMGGSTVWGEDSDGVRIDNRDTIASQLETTLNARASARGLQLRVQVLNAGVVGYLLYQNLTYFDHYVADFKPDLIIAMDGHNDLDALIMGLKPYHHRNEPFFERAVNEPTFFDLVWWNIRYGESKSLLVRKVYLFLWRKLNHWAIERWHRSLGKSQVTQAEIEEWLREYTQTVRRFDASARIAGARAVFTVQAEAVGERHKQLTPEEIKIRDNWRDAYKWLHTVMRDRLISQLQETTQQYGLWFQDISDVFKGEPQQVYLDYTHLTSRGAQVMAQRLADLVENMVFSGASSPPTAIPNT